MALPEESPGVLAERLRAIGNWMQDSVANQTSTGRTLLQAADWLKRLEGKVCGGGIIGCYGGPKCQSDHK
jgi:hypothetical protein